MLRSWKQYSTKRAFSSIVSIFEERGLLKEATSLKLGCESWTSEARSSKKAVYVGFDPTASYLHLGNVMQVVSLVRAGTAGLRPIALVGGATGQIGDPSGKNSERVMLSEAQIDINVKGVTKNLQKLVDRISNVAVERLHDKIQSKELVDCREDFIILNNNDFYEGMGFISFLRDVGKLFNMSTLLGRHSMSSRLQSEEGISYTEFSYQLLQGYDFYKLNKEQDCVLQIGGSDQYGNICSGIDLVKKMGKGKVFGLTTPLLVNADGQKFGKSEGNAVWVSDSNDHLLDCHQYLMNVTDSQVPGLLKALTFLDLEEISVSYLTHIFGVM